MASNISNAAQNFTYLPLAKQIGLLLGLAASIALAVAVVMWSMKPTMRPLFSNLSGRDSSEIVDVLQRNNIAFNVQKENGAIMVSADDVYSARMKLASEGLPHGNGQGYEMFNQESGFSSSQFMETARYRHALESELARTIMNLSNIKSARVHLAIPKQTGFLRDEAKPTASVFIDVYRGMSVKSNSIAAIVNLVASSVPDLDASHVTVVDQNGELLNEGSGNNSVAMADRFLDYRHQLESAYADRIQELLTPIVGPGKIKAKVSADIDFTSSEQTRESYNPDLPALRSEQSVEEERTSLNNGAGGVPGSLSNQPPPASTPQASNSAAATSTTAKNNDKKTQSTKNFELDKTISHTKQQPGQIRRLTIAVLVANRIETAKDGTTKSIPLTPEDTAKYRSLVTNAIGFDAQRGDSIDIINTDFAKPEPVEEMPVKTIWQQPWVWDLAKQVSAGIFILILLFGVLLPSIKNLAKNELPKTMMVIGADGKPSQVMQGPTDLGIPTQLKSFEDRMGVVQNMASSDPKRVAQVVKTWVDGS